MSSLHEALVDYLTMRRALGYKLEREGKLLPQFVDFIEDCGEQHLSTQAALAWATLPVGSAGWWSARLRLVRGFAIYMHAIDPENEVPATDLLPRAPRRATPYLYDQAQISALIAVAATLRTPHRIATIRTLIGLLVVTGMRIGEAVGLDREDFDARNGCLVIRGAKFGKSRELALHPSTTAALRRYLRRADRPPSTPDASPLLITMVGTRLLKSDAQRTFKTLRRRAGIQARSGSCRPRLHEYADVFVMPTSSANAWRGGLIAA
jgi:integrase